MPAEKPAKIKVQCSHCGALYKSALEHLGQSARCKHCGQVFVMLAGETLAPLPKAEPQSILQKHFEPCPYCGEVAEILPVSGFLRLRCRHCREIFTL